MLLGYCHIFMQLFISLLLITLIAKAVVVGQEDKRCRCEIAAYLYGRYVVSADGPKAETVSSNRVR